MSLSLEAAAEIAKEVLAGKSRSYVDDARTLARFVVDTHASTQANIKRIEDLLKESKTLTLSPARAGDLPDEGDA